MLRKTLLLCGILSSALYVAMKIFIGLQWKEYSFLSQTVSELSAIDAPTRSTWVPWGLLYTALVACFGVGVWKSAGENARLRIVGVFLVVYGIVGLFWPPMHQREVLAAGGGTVSDTLHLVFSFVTVGLMLLAMGYGAIAFGNSTFGKRYKSYTIATIAMLCVFGALTSGDASAISANGPTPLVGVWERILIALFLLWIVVTSVVLLPEHLSVTKHHHRRLHMRPAQ